MQTYDVKGPDGRIYRFKGPEGVPQEELEAAARREYLRQPAPDKSKEGFFAAAKAGTQRLAGEAALTAGKMGIIEPERAEQIYAAQQQRAAERFRPTEDSWLESPLLKLKELAGGSVPYMMAPVAVGGLGALAATGVGAPAAAGIAALGGAGLTSLTQFTGSNLARNVEEGKRLAETSGAGAVAAAIPQAALDVVSLRMLPGIGRIFNRAGVEISEETAHRIAQQKLRERVADYTLATGKAAGIEGTTEAAQQVLERLQAGLSITDADARKEYFESFIGGAVLGGAIAPVGTALDRGRAVREGTRMGEERLKTGLEMGPPDLPALLAGPPDLSGAFGPPTWAKGLESAGAPPLKLGLSETPDQRRSRVEQGIAGIEAELQARAQGTEPLTPEQIIALDAQMEPKRQQLEALKQELAEIGPPPPAPPPMASLQQQETKLLQEIEAARGRGDLSLQARLARRLVEVRRLMGKAPTEEAMPTATAETPTPEVPTVETPQPTEAEALYQRAVEAVQASGKASVSSIQQALTIGYKPAAKLLKQMEEAGVVSPPQANGRRTVLQPAQTAEPAEAVKPEPTEALPAPTTPAAETTELTAAAETTAPEPTAPAEKPTKPAKAAQAVAPAEEQAEAPLPEYKTWPPTQEPAEGAPKGEQYWGPPKITPTREKRTDEYERNLLGALRRLTNYFEPRKGINPQTQAVEMMRPEPTEAQVEAVTELLTRGLERGNLRAEAQRATRAQGMADEEPRMRGVNIDAVRELVNDIAKSPEKRQAVQKALRDPAGSDFFDTLSKRLLTRERREYPVRKPSPTPAKADSPVRRLSSAYKQAAGAKLGDEDAALMQQLRPLLPRIATATPEVGDTDTREVVSKWLSSAAQGKASATARAQVAKIVQSYGEKAPPKPTKAQQVAEKKRAEAQAKADKELEQAHAALEKATAPLKEKLAALQDAAAKLVQARDLEGKAAAQKRNEAITGLMKAEKALEQLRLEIAAPFAKQASKVLPGWRAQAMSADYSAAQQLIRVFERATEQAAEQLFTSRSGMTEAQLQNSISLREAISELRQAYESPDSTAQIRSDAVKAVENALTYVRNAGLPNDSVKRIRRFDEMLELADSAAKRYVERMGRFANIQQTLRDIDAARFMALSVQHAVTKGNADRLIEAQEAVVQAKQEADLAQESMNALATQPMEEQLGPLRKEIRQLRAKLDDAVKALSVTRDKKSGPLSGQLGKALLQLNEDVIIAIDPLKPSEMTKTDDGWALNFEERTVRAIMHTASPQAIARLEAKYGKEAREADEQAVRRVYGDVYGADGVTPVSRRRIEFQRGLSPKEEARIAALEEKYADLLAQRFTGDSVNDKLLSEAREAVKAKIETYNNKATERQKKLENAYATMIASRKQLEDAFAQTTTEFNQERDPLLAEKDRLLQELTVERTAEQIKAILGLKKDFSLEVLKARLDASYASRIDKLDAKIKKFEDAYSAKQDKTITELAKVNTAFERDRGVFRTTLPTRAEIAAARGSVTRAAEKKHIDVLRGQIELAMLITHKAVERIAATQHKRRVSSPLMRKLSTLAQFYTGVGRSQKGGDGRGRLLESTRVSERDVPFSAFEIRQINELTDAITGKPALKRSEAQAPYVAGEQPTIKRAAATTLESFLTEAEATVLARTDIKMSEVSSIITDAIDLTTERSSAVGRAFFSGKLNKLLTGPALKGESGSAVEAALRRLYSIAAGETAGTRRPLTEAERLAQDAEFLSSSAVERRAMSVARQQKIAERMKPRPINDEEASALRDDNDFYARQTVNDVSADVQQALESNDLPAALRLLSENASSPENRETARRLLDNIEGVRVVVADEVTLDGKAVEGKYNPQSLTITLDRALLSEETLLHEAAHPATLSSLDAPKGEQAQAARAELEKLYSEVKADPKFAKEYASTDLKEFVSELLSNADLRNKLDAREGLLKRVYRALMRLLGFDTQTASQKAMAQAYKLFQPASAASADKTIGSAGRVKDAAVTFRGRRGHASNESVIASLRVIDEDDDIAFEYPKRVGAVMLENIYRVDKGETGRATPLLQSIANWADANGKKLVLMPSGEIANSRAALKNWYERNGFVSKADGAMEREPVRRVLASAVRARGINAVMNGVFPGTKPVAAASVGSDVADAVSRVVGRNASLGDKYTAFTAGLTVRQAMLDRWASVEHILKQGIAKGKIDETRALQLRVNMRLHDQVNQITSAGLTRGGIQLTTDKESKGVKYVEAVGGANAIQMANALRKAKVGNEQFTEQLFTTWLAVKRAESMEGGYRKLNFGVDAKGNRLFDAQDGAAIKAKVNSDPATREAFEEARRIYREYNDGLITLLEKSGVIDSTKAAELKKGDFVPFYRISGDVVELDIGASRPVTIGNVIDQPYLRELVGGEDKIMPVFSSMARNTGLLVQLSLRNLQAKDVANMLQETGLATIVSKRIEQNGRIIRFKYGGKEWSAVLDAAAFKEQGLTPEMVVQGLQGVKTAIPAVVQAMSYPASLLRKSITRTPVYVVRQMIRDPLNAWLTTGGDINPLKVAAGGIKNMFSTKSTKTEDTLSRAGVVSSHVFSNSPEDVARILQQITAGGSNWNAAMAKLDGMALKADAQTRAAVYDNFRNKGMTHVEALLNTLESMNFTRRGTSASMLWLSTIIPFFNAQVQGLDIFYRALRGDVPYEQKMHARAELLRRGAMVAAGTMVYALLMQEDESYKNATPEERAMSWFVPIPGGGSLRVPIPFEFGMLFKSLPEALINTAFGDTRVSEAMGALAKQLTMSSPLSLPTAIQPIIELTANYSFFTDQPIESARERNLTPGERFRQNTSEIAKLIGGTLNVSPIAIEHLVRGYTGSTGILALSLINPILRPFSAQEMGERPERSLSELPMIGSLVQPENGRGLINAAFDDINRIQRAASTYREMIESGRVDDAQSFAERFSREMALTSTGGAFRQQMGELAQQKRMIAASAGLSGEQKRAQIDEIKKLEIMMARQIRDLVNASE
jgi:hypothetical protein